MEVLGSPQQGSSACNLKIEPFFFCNDVNCGERAFDDCDKDLDAFCSLPYERDKDKEKENDKEKDKDKHKDKGAYDACNKDLDAFRSLLSEETSFSVNLLDD